MVVFFNIIKIIFMKLLYDLSLRTYKIAINIAKFFNEKAHLFHSGRKNIFENFKKNVDFKEKNIWFHCASLGEFEQGRPLIEIIKKKYPDYKIIITFFSPSGYEVRKTYKQADFISYLPLDSSINAEKFIQIVQPKLVFFIKYEFWFYYLKTLKKYDIPCFLISGIFRKNQMFFKFYGKWYARILENFTHLFVQNKTSFELLQKIGIQNLSIAGDTRFDRVLKISETPKKFHLIEKFKQNKTILVAGSTWKKDENILIQYIKNNKNSLKFIIAPHEIHQDNINRLIHEIGENVVAYSKANEKNIQDFKVLIIDNIGMLSSIYQYGEIAYVGGAFGKGLHNILEPATFGVPIFFGTKYQKFQEAIDLINLKSAFSIKNFEMFEEQINILLNDKIFFKKTGEISKKYILDNKGGTKKILDFVKNFH